MRAGVPLADFWRLTLYEISLYVEAWKEDLEFQHMLMKDQAWRSAYLGRVKKMPDHGKYIANKHEKKRTAESHKKRIEEWNQKQPYYESIMKTISDSEKPRKR